MPFRDKPVTVGIRPEDIEVQAKNSPTGVLYLEVDLIESLGEGYLATCTGRGLTLTGLCQTKFVRGQKVMLTIAWSRTMLFDAASGQTLSSTAQGLETG